MYRVETIAVAAHKGGAGKTTVAVNLAAAMAAQGRRVLLVDLDPQGAAAAALGVTVSKPTVYEALMGGADPRQAILGTSVDGLAMFAADLDLAGAEVELPRMGAWQGSLTRLLAPLEGLCDVAILDTPPGLGVLSLCALVAARSAVAVCPPDFLAYRTLPHLLETLERAGARVLGIVP
ncbi:MAG TPA: AAA family ATPase, partial [Candidatus Dormibacteraeota bacterium]|nr:AAA family ATPase [Candidatus Dormibacteraeota bacterium]